MDDHLAKQERQACSMQILHQLEVLHLKVRAAFADICRRVCRTNFDFGTALVLLDPPILHHYSSWRPVPEL